MSVLGCKCVGKWLFECCAYLCACLSRRCVSVYTGVNGLVAYGLRGGASMCEYICIYVLMRISLQCILGYRLGNVCVGMQMCR
jgi:hypothetical protein